MRKIFEKFSPKLLNNREKGRCIRGSKEMVELIAFNPGLVESLLTCDKNWIYC